uniref:TnpV protein n=1 Tax=Clostridium faecium TaxID=2762223 RepID=UPI0036F2AB51
MELNYIEKDGILYPQIQISEEQKLDNTDLGKYGRMAMRYLKENHPNRYSLLLMEGKLTDTMLKVNEEAYNKMDLLMEQMLKEDPITNPMNTMETYKKKEQKKMVAEEIILKEIVLKVR